MNLRRLAIVSTAPFKPCDYVVSDQQRISSLIPAALILKATNMSVIPDSSKQGLIRNRGESFYLVHLWRACLDSRRNAPRAVAVFSSVKAFGLQNSVASPAGQELRSPARMLTERQNAVLEFLRDRYTQTGLIPTTRNSRPSRL